MTFGVIEKEEPLLAELIALAFEAAGHDCLVFQNVDHATRVLHAIHVDAIVLDIHLPDRNGLDWLETMATTWPDLPSRTLLLTDSSLTSDEAARIKKLRADIAFRPFSLVGVERVVLGRLQKIESKPAGRLKRGGEQQAPIELSN